MPPTFLFTFFISILSAHTKFFLGSGHWYDRYMNLTEKNLKILEALFREGNDFMNSHYPRYTPRKQDGGYFELMTKARDNRIRS